MPINNRIITNDRGREGNIHGTQLNLFYRPPLDLFDSLGPDSTLGPADEDESIAAVLAFLLLLAFSLDVFASALATLEGVVTRGIQEEEEEKLLAACERKEEKLTGVEEEGVVGLVFP